MYLPPHFDDADPARALAIMQACPLASLVGLDEEGFPFVTHLPLHAQQRSAVDGGPDAFVLHGHVARGNPHAGFLRQRPEALVTFLGPQAYLSPAVYPDRARVPTWNYLAVHARVRARLIEAESDKDALLKRLIGDHEPPYAQQWRELGPEFARRMLAGIVAFELDVLSWQCKIKLNQHRPESHAAMHDQYAAGDDDARELARWMERLGLVQPTQGAST
jgi:transcriptional regulator